MTKKIFLVLESIAAYFSVKKVVIECIFCQREKVSQKTQYNGRMSSYNG